MVRIPIVLGIFVILLMPVYASAQTPDRITVLENFGHHDRGEPIFVYGQIASMLDDSFLIMQIFNPQGDLCQIQQLMPLPDGAFITDAIPLNGRICGIPGEYEIKLFYGDYSKSTAFTVSSDSFSEPSNKQAIVLAKDLVSDHASFIANIHDILSPAPILMPESVSELESVYVNMLGEYFADDLIFEINPLIRPAVSSSLDSVQHLQNEDEISLEIAKSIDKIIFASVFYYEIGDKAKAIDLLTDAFVDVRNVNPDKASVTRTPTFDELEETLLNLMKKSDTVMSKSIKHEVGFIFARGTAPIHTDDITELIDILSKSRYLDVVSRKQSDLYKMVQNDWSSLKSSLVGKESIADLISSSAQVAELHHAAILLRELDTVDRFISSDMEENGDLANLIMPNWLSLERDLQLATSVDDILESESEINQMVQIIDISSRISKSVEISQASGVNSALTDDWKLLLERVDNADSIDDILEIVSEFDKSMNELREKRNPLMVLEFQYESMKEKAELQSDYENLFLIDNALKILDTARQMESGNPSIMRIDRIEVLLTWVSEISPGIKADLDSYNKDVYKIRASDILQRAKSLENLVDLSLTKNRFLPNYVEFTETFNEKIDNVRDLVIKNDLAEADILVRDLFDEWTVISQAYADDPNGSENGYTLDELKRIEFRKKLDSFSNMVSTFYTAGFSEHVDEYNKKMNDAHDLIQIANFVDAESKILEISTYLSEHLTLHNSGIVYDISFDSTKNTWIINGAVEKSVSDRRENLYVTVYGMDGTSHSGLEFTDTRQGNFFTQWIAPTDPGLYVVMLQYKDSKASQIVNVEHEFAYKYSESDLDMVELAREFEELKSFAQKFGGDVFTENPGFASVINEITFAFADKDAKQVDENLDELKILVERYLPVRSKVAVIEAVYDVDKLIVSGAVQKTLAFREDLFVNVFDQKGNVVEEIALKDSSSGLFTEVISRSFDSGVYVAQLQYHDVIVTDFFSVR